MKQSRLRDPSFLLFIIFITLNFNNVNGFITSSTRPLLVMTRTSTRKRIGTSSRRTASTRISISKSSSSSENFSVVIGKGSTLNLEGNGTLTFSDSLLVEGTLKGKLKCLHDINQHRTNNDDNDDDDDDNNITLVKIGLQGELHADVNCVSNLVVDGVLRGDVMCKTVVIGSTAHVIGDIVAEEM
jgi:cytoskeletal protein CcmA (bactofilin family)